LEQLEAEKQATGMAAYSVRQLLKRASDLCGMDLVDATCPIISLIRQYVLRWIYQDGTIDDDAWLDIIDGKAAITDVVASWDPNEMVGPQGVGEKHYIGDVQTVNYRILFENKAEAGDAAYRVRISDVLDENVFDVSTVRFGETSHDGVGYNWVMTRDGNRLSWDIQGIELPPNINAPEGEGYVSFSVDLKPGLKDGTELKNKAEIIFDKNFPIETNEFVNTLDLAAPTTLMADVVYNSSNGMATVNFQSVDAGAGIDSYLLFASKNGEDFTYEGQYYGGSIDYTVDADTQYSFYVLAVDAVGNIERVIPKSADVFTSGIATIAAGQLPELKIFTTDGIYVGNKLRGLKKGVYLVNGKKLIVK